MDFVSLPNVRSADDVAAVRAALDTAGGARVKLVAHVSTAPAIRAYDAILEAADVILVSRGYMGARRGERVDVGHPGSRPAELLNESV